MGQAAAETLEAIARKHLHIETLETRKSGNLDFYEVAVWSVAAALEAAFHAGMAAAQGEPTMPARSDEGRIMAKDVQREIDMIFRGFNYGTGNSKEGAISEARALVRRLKADQAPEDLVAMAEDACARLRSVW